MTDQITATSNLGFIVKESVYAGCGADVTITNSQGSDDDLRRKKRSTEVDRGAKAHSVSGSTVGVLLR